MSKITLGDVVDKLYAEFDKINDPKLTGDKQKEQIERTKAVVSIAKQITDTARLALDAQMGKPDMLDGARVPKMLEMDN